MGTATSIRASVRTLITNLGSTATLYPFSAATKTENDEGDSSVSSWNSGSSIKVVSSNHYKLRRVLGMQGEENNEGARVILIRDDVTITARDRLTIGSDAYLINEIKSIDPIEDTLIAQRCILTVDENY